MNYFTVLPFLEETKRSFSFIHRYGQKYTILYLMAYSFHPEP